MGENTSYENGFLIFEDYNFVTYTKRRGRRVDWHEKKQHLHNFTVSAYLYKPLQNCNLSLVSNSANLRRATENKLFKRVQQNIKWLIKFIIRIKRRVRNIYLFVKFVSSKCILKLSTFYYLKYIVEKIYDEKLETSVRVVLPVSDLHKLYTFVYHQNFCFMNYYKKFLSRRDARQLRRFYCPVVVLNGPNRALTIPYERVYGRDVVKMGIREGRSPKNSPNTDKSRSGRNSPKGETRPNPNKPQRGSVTTKTHQRKSIKIKKEKIKRVIGKNLHTSDIGLFAGTFDKMHFGHILLLFYSIFLTKKFYYVGLYNNKNINKKKYAQEIDDLKLRIYNISDVLFLIKNVYQVEFSFLNFEHIMPFIKIKNSHRILFQIMMNQKNELLVGHRQGGYRKCEASTPHRIEATPVNTCTTKRRYLEKYLSRRSKKRCVTQSSEKTYQGVHHFGTNEMKKRIEKYLLFHVGIVKAKRCKQKDNKIIVLKRIHDPFSFAVDIKDLYCLTMSKESEANGYNLVNKRKLQKGNESAHSNKRPRGGRISPDQKCEKCKQINIEPNGVITLLEKPRTSLNIFDTINLGDGEKISSTLVREENIFLKKKKFAKFLRHFVDACLFFHIDHFLIQMYADIFLHKNGRTPFKNLYINKVKDYFCKGERSKWETQGSCKSGGHKRGHKSGRKMDHFIVNDFFRNLFVLLSFFVNHFTYLESRTHDKIQLFVKISIALSFFFYNNMILLLVKEKEALINQNFRSNHKNVEQRISMFHTCDDKALRIYVHNVEEPLLEEVLNQILVWTLSLISLSVLCKFYHSEILPRVKRGKSVPARKSARCRKFAPLGNAAKKILIAKEPALHPPVTPRNNRFVRSVPQCNPHRGPDKLSKEDSRHREEKEQFQKPAHGGSSLRKMNYDAYFYNYWKNRGLHKRGPIVTPYTLFNHSLTRRFKMRNSLLRHNPYIARAVGFSGMALGGEAIPCSEKPAVKSVSRACGSNCADGRQYEDGTHYLDESHRPQKSHSGANGSSTRVSIDKPEGDTQAEARQDEVYHGLSLKRERTILNNLYKIKIRSEEDAPSWINKMTDKEIENYVRGKKTKTRSYHNERYTSLMQININNGQESFPFRKVLIYKYLDSYFISFFSYYIIKHMGLNQCVKGTHIEYKKIHHLLFLLLVHFEKHIEMVVNSFLKRTWELKPKRRKHPFDPYVLYQKRYSLIHRYFAMNLSPLNNYDLDFERKYDFKKSDTTFADTPFHIKIRNWGCPKGGIPGKACKFANQLSVLTFYNTIFQSILTHENYYYPFFASLNYLYLDNT
ncbi:hypothetical protein C922_03015 [Plasmodium inui San Antonio 1]|uniref:Phosphopantetheine adenylyltransferase n=1 Tax=Plasmodium inui San Antonio 1 TaxID=1237626 RepID=W7A4M9_9APIC|nr:hypothetical protein C922_03015 [Plasmodium inui San Antonio 1]EUD66690.1 hypothetical protein C922_03015 [Plasmodium inui San Antonio 1]